MEKNEEPFYLEENGTLIYQTSAWLSKQEADSLFADLIKQVPWMKKFNPRFEVDEPRLSCGIGDGIDGRGNPIVHHYSGTSTPQINWDSTKYPVLKRVRELRDRIEQETGLFHDSASLQLYRTGDDYIGEHADLELKPSISRIWDIESNETVYALSLGASRRFFLRNKEDKSRRMTFMVNHGDMLAMEGKCQQQFTHGVPKMSNKANPIGPRISITWRLLGEWDF